MQDGTAEYVHINKRQFDALKFSCGLKSVTRGNEPSEAGSAGMQDELQQYSQDMRKSVTRTVKKLKVTQWRELSYQEQVTLHKPHCLAVYDTCGNKYVLHATNVSAHDRSCFSDLPWCHR